MPKKLFALLTVTALALNLFADKNKDKEEERRERKQSGIAYYNIKNAPEVMEVRIRRGENITFLLEENPTTGYVWVANYDRRRCKVDLRQRASQAKRVGAPGLVEVKIKLNTSRDTTVELSYRRPFEKGVPPLKTIKCHLVHRNYRGKFEDTGDAEESKSGKDDGKSEKQK